MSLANNQITAKNFKEFYEQILPYLGGSGSDAKILQCTPAQYSALSSDEKLNGTVYFVSSDGVYSFKLFYDGAIVIRENIYDNTDLKLFVCGLSKDANALSVTDSELLSYLSDITNNKLKACSTYDTAVSTTSTGILAIGNWGSGMKINTYVPGYTAYKAGTFYGVIDLTQAPVSTAGAPAYQQNTYENPYSHSINAIYYMNKLYTSNTDFLVHYSTDEQVVGTWIDGKPVYQKTFSFSDSGGSSRHWITVGTIANMDKAINAYGVYAGFVLGGYWGSSSDDYCGIMFDGNTLKIVRNGLTDGSGYVTVQYTKTTD